MEPAEAVYALVRMVPEGAVVTYGQVAEMVEGVSLTARQVGQIMNAAPEGVPWQRVVGAGGHLPIGKRSAHLAAMQRRLLEREGVAFLPDGRVDMLRYRWQGGEPVSDGLFEAQEPNQQVRPVREA